MAQMAFAGPLDEADLGDRGGSHPLHLRHLVGGHSPAPSRLPGVRQIDERAARGVERREPREDLAADVRREAGSDLSREPQPAVVVIADEQRVDAVRTGPVSADDELLLAIQLQLDPREWRSPAV